MVSDLRPSPGERVWLPGTRQSGRLVGLVSRELCVVRLSSRHADERPRPGLLAGLSEREIVEGLRSCRPELARVLTLRECRESVAEEILGYLWDGLCVSAGARASALDAIRRALELDDPSGAACAELSDADVALLARGDGEEAASRELLARFSVVAAALDECEEGSLRPSRAESVARLRAEIVALDALRSPSALRDWRAFVFGSTAASARPPEDEVLEVSRRPADEGLPGRLVALRTMGRAPAVGDRVVVRPDRSWYDDDAFVAEVDSAPWREGAGDSASGEVLVNFLNEYDEDDPRGRWCEPVPASWLVATIDDDHEPTARRRLAGRQVIRVRRRQDGLWVVLPVRPGEAFGEVVGLTEAEVDAGLRVLADEDMEVAP